MNAPNLVLSRQEAEGVALTISPEDLRKLAQSGQPLRIEVTAVRLSRRQARLSFQAPKSVTIRRLELEATPAA